METLDQCVVFEGVLHDAALYADPAAVYQADLAQAGRVGFVDVFFDHRGDVARLEGVEVELGFDRDADGLVHGQASDSNTAVTEVDSPPRTENSPTIVIRLGLQAATRSSRIWFVTAS